jgi:hypothetical protein
MVTTSVGLASKNALISASVLFAGLCTLFHDQTVINLDY